VDIKETFREVLYAILPVTLVITILQFTIIWLPMRDFIYFLLGAILAFFGFSLFLIGVRVSLLPIGEAFGVSLMKNEKLWLLIGLSVCLGFSVTIAEPGLQILANSDRKCFQWRYPEKYDDCSCIFRCRIVPCLGFFANYL